MAAINRLIHWPRSPISVAAFAFAVVFVLNVQGSAEEFASLVLRNGHIWTADADHPHAESVAIGGERILRVGTNGDVAALVGPSTNVIDCEGRFVCPGFIEGHGHFLSLGESKLKLDLTGATTWDDVVQLVVAASRVAPAGKWIDGRGWHQGKWKHLPKAHVEGYPDAAELSRLVPNHPVVLTHGTGHMCLANEAAMKLAGIDQRTEPPKGGQILRDPSGRAIGVFRESAMELIYRAHDRALRNRSPQEVRVEQLAAIEAASKECLRFGVTSFQDAGSSCRDVELLRERAEVGKLPIRLWVMLNESNEVLRSRLKQIRAVGVGHDHLTVRGIKRMLDGALGTHGAWMLEPYDDLPTSRGLNLLSSDSLRETAELALENDFQLCVHAIGDLANRTTLDVFERVFAAHPDKRDLRWRIEHAQHVDPQDIPRFASLGVVASMQGNHATSDGPFVFARLGERRARQSAYAWRSLLDAKATIVNGTDAPVETLNPLDSFFASVSRRMANGEPFVPEQCMTRHEALESYTIRAAHSVFEDSLKGSITPGKLADLVVLTHDILNVPLEDLRSTKVQMTVVGGEVLYTAP